MSAVHQDVPVSCPVCGARAVAVVIVVDLQVCSCRWVAVPPRWMVAEGATVESLSRGLVRCPACVPVGFPPPAEEAV